MNLLRAVLSRGGGQSAEIVATTSVAHKRAIEAPRRGAREALMGKAWLLVSA
jgi:hypothetical protein